MATKQQLEAFRALVKNGFERDRAKSIVMKLEGPEEPKQEEISPEAKAVSEVVPIGSTTPGFFQEGRPGVSTEEPQNFLTSGALEGIIRNQETPKESTPKPVKPEGKGVEGVLDRITSNLDERGSVISDNLAQEAKRVKEGTGVLDILGAAARQPIEAIQVAGQGAGMLWDVAGELIGSAIGGTYDKLVPEGVKEFNKEQMQEFMESDAGKAGIAAIEAGQEGYAAFSESFPETAATFNAIGNLMALSGLKKVKNNLSGKPTPAQLKEAEALQKEAESNVAEFLQPSKDKTTRTAKKITPQILERDIKGTREEVFELASQQKRISGKAIEELEKAGKIGGTMQKQDLLDVLDNVVENENLYLQKVNALDTGKTLDIIPGQQAKVKSIDTLADFISGMPDEIDLKTHGLTLKRAFDEVYNGTDVTLNKFENVVRLDLGNALRKEISKQNPDLAKLNKEYSFYKGLETVVGETIDRRFGKGQGGGLETKSTAKILSAGAGAGGAVGYAVGGAQGAAVGAVLGRQTGFSLDKYLSTPKRKLASAQKNKALADSIASGDPKKMKTAVNAIIVALALDPNDFKYEEEGSGGFIEESGGFLDAIGSLRD